MPSWTPEHELLIVLDFDHTIFNTTKFVNEQKKLFKERFGINGETFMKQRDEVKKCCVVIDIDKFIAKLPHEGKGDMHDAVKEILQKHGKDWVAPDVWDFFEKNKDNADILLVTHGNQELQNAKMDSADIPDYIHRNISTKSKADVLEDLVPRYKKIIFIDDKSENIDEVKQRFSNVITYFIKRPEDHPYGHRISVCDCADETITNLSQVVE